VLGDLARLRPLDLTVLDGNDVKRRMKAARLLENGGQLVFDECRYRAKASVLSKYPRPNLVKFDPYLTKRIGERVTPAPM